MQVLSTDRYSRKAVFILILRPGRFGLSYVSTVRTIKTILQNGLLAASIGFHLLQTEP